MRNNDIWMTIQVGNIETDDDGTSRHFPESTYRARLTFTGEKISADSANILKDYVEKALDKFKIEGQI